MRRGGSFRGIRAARKCQESPGERSDYGGAGLRGCSCLATVVVDQRDAGPDRHKERGDDVFVLSGAAGRPLYGNGGNGGSRVLVRFAEKRQKFSYRPLVRASKARRCSSVICVLTAILRSAGARSGGPATDSPGTTRFDRTRPASGSRWGSAD